MRESRIDLCQGIMAGIRGTLITDMTTETRADTRTETRVDTRTDTRIGTRTDTRREYNQPNLNPRWGIRSAQ